MNSYSLCDDSKSYKKTVLVVDDKSVILYSIIACLEEGYNVHTMTSSVDALTFLLNHDPDIIVMDILMPEIDGYTMMKIIRGMQKFQHTPILFLTSYPTIVDILKVSGLGMQDFIMKPVNKEILLDRIEKSLNRVCVH